jgi:hypothetical protein
MQELAKFQVERSSVDPSVFTVTPEDQTSSTEVNGVQYDDTAALSKGPMAKNPLGERGLNAVQV